MTTRTIMDADGDTYVYRFWQWQGIGLSACVGFVSSLPGTLEHLTTGELGPHAG
jgi:hypothetical protein